ncbi:hypothetical protein ACFC34_42130 [Streptomyces sp. NPDC056053]|uniref:hypothetical protein n=1 Tax=Streptomyces sp. NPDC056053 TaxID=3345696 RepID=UPI0035D624A7
MIRPEACSAVDEDFGPDSATRALAQSGRRTTGSPARTPPSTKSALYTATVEQASEQSTAAARSGDPDPEATILRQAGAGA